MANNKDDTIANNPGDIPIGEHFAILTFAQGTSPGYDKGDPDDVFDYTIYTVYATRAAWEARIREYMSPVMYHDPVRFVALQGNRPVVKMSFSIEIAKEKVLR
jgi:hypothetical protein